jgi:hypothetical protein
VINGFSPSLIAPYNKSQTSSERVDGLIHWFENLPGIGSLSVCLSFCLFFLFLSFFLSFPNVLRSLPEALLPSFYTLYFDSVDSQGHLYGPGSIELNYALAEVDAAIGMLLRQTVYHGLVWFGLILSFSYFLKSRSYLIFSNA